MIKKKKRNRKNSSENKKVKNARITIYDGISFKSKLEVYCYKKLKENGIPFEYEKYKFTLFEGVKPLILTSIFPNKQGILEVNTDKLRDITYTPDFVGDSWIIETKGRANDSYPLKLKMFRKLMESQNKYRLFMEPHNQKQVDEAIKLIKELQTI